MRPRKKITVVGAGYVGMSLSVLLAQKNNVYVHDIDEERVHTINSGKSTIYDECIDDYLKDIKKNKEFKALVTAGPTHEYIDPVRYISNKSSGKQGYEIAKSLKKNGFETTLISGPTNLDPISGVNLINVSSAKEMFNATLENLPADVAIFSAAVGDYKVKNKKKDKIKKKESMDLSLEKNIDILGHISNHNSLRPKIVIGFAAETNNLTKNSKTKLSEKNCDWIIANDVSDPSIGFESDVKLTKEILSRVFMWLAPYQWSNPTG